MANFTLNNTNVPLISIPAHGYDVHIDAYHADCSADEWILPAVVGSYIYVKRIIIGVAGVANGVTVTVGFGLTAVVTNIMTGPLQQSLQSTAVAHIRSSVWEFDYAKGRNMGRRGALSFGLVGDCSAAVPMNIIADVKVCKDLSAG